MSAKKQVEARKQPRLKAKYLTEVVPKLAQEFHYSNTMQVPKLEKIVVNVGVGEATQNAKALDHALEDVTLITGQKPSIRRARVSVSSFKLREGMPIGVTVTLRGDRMYEFLDRLVAVALPRIRDFRGINAKAFDGRGNYTLGLKEQIIFPEVDYEKTDKLRGLEVCMVTSASNDNEGRMLLKQLGMPFRESSHETR